jgi:hypothetical protein
MRALRITAAVAFASTAVLLATSSCDSPDTSAVTEIVAPDLFQFKGEQPNGAALPMGQAGVSLVLERRCGSLDCHGQVSRPLRIYGQRGLRFVDDGGNFPGGALTTETERELNYEAVIGLQPEMMTLVVTGQDPPEALMLLRKPLQLERHKGGPVFVSGDPAYNCITTWLAGQTDFNSCAQAAQ